MATILNEDDIYRTSSQYRLWTFTPESLAAARQTTVDTAAARVRAILGKPVETMTVAEELVLVRKNCERAVQLIDFVAQWPESVKISTVQFLKRFYITASCMEYPPSKMVASAVFLGAKANGFWADLTHFAKQSGKKEQDITAPEFKLAQGNRFAFEVRIPMRGLEGGHMMLIEIGNGNCPVETREELKQEMIRICGQGWEHKVGHTISLTKEILRGPALLSDAYLLYTPPQIWLAALSIVNKDLATLYLRFALASFTEEQQNKIKQVIQGCADLLKKDEEQGKLVDAQIKSLNQKLKGCTNPQTSDLIELNAAQKRDPDPNSANGHASKKLKTEQGQIEDPFGPAIPKPEPPT